MPKKITWDEKIKRLMKNFCLEEKYESVIAEVKESAKGNESEDLLYDRAWRKFRSIMMAS